MATSVRPILEDQLATVSGWQLAVEDGEGFLRALFSRQTGIDR